MEKEITKKIRVYGIVRSEEVSVIVDLMLKSSHREARRQ